MTHLSGHSVLGSQTNQPNTANQHSQFKRNHQYQYDVQGRLTEHKLTDYQNQTGITEVFAFDPASNRVPVKIADDTAHNTQINHGRPRELIQNGKRIRYTYDSHGRVLYKTTESTDEREAKQNRQGLQLQYNANNELEKSLRTQYQGNKIIKTLTEYHYDAFGRRIAKHSEVRQLNDHQGQLTQNSKTQYKHTHMLWDSDLPIQEYSDTHVYTTIYDQGSFKPVARLVWLRDDISVPINDEPTIKQDNPHIKQDTTSKSKIQVYHYHNDQLGTPNELTNDKGEVVWLADYEAWGNTAKVFYNEIKINQIQVNQNKLQPIRFQGQYFDEETGLHYNRFRYYDPDTGMFTSRDPIELYGGLNVFAYAPNPTGWIDPLGLAAVGKAVGFIDDIAKLASRLGKTGVKAKTGCTSCTKDDDDENSCRVLVNNVKSKLRVVKTRYYLLLVDEHNLYKNHRKTKNKHYKHGSWDGHIFKFKESQTELGQSIAQAGPKCMKYAPKDTDEWRYKEPPSMPDRDVGLEGYQNL